MEVAGVALQIQGLAFRGKNKVLPVPGSVSGQIDSHGRRAARARIGARTQVKAQRCARTRPPEPPSAYAGVPHPASLDLLCKRLLPLRAERCITEVNHRPLLGSDE